MKILLRYIRTVYFIVSSYAFRSIANEQADSIRRRSIDRCWCGGGFDPVKGFPKYGKCRTCGCYVNRQPPEPEELAKIYSFENYWKTRQRAKGNPGITQRDRSDRADGRLEYWVDLIRRHAPEAKEVLEVGCAHGSLLARLAETGLHCVGLEPDETTARWVRDHHDLDVRTGFFPDPSLPVCDLFLAFDVIEHSPDPIGFMKGISQIVRSGGVAILQTPIDRSTNGTPFTRKLKPVFDDIEHLYLFTDESLSRLADTAGMRVVDASEKMALHHEIVVLHHAS